jgi:hypothetical protein
MRGGENNGVRKLEHDFLRDVCKQLKARSSFITTYDQFNVDTNYSLKMRVATSLRNKGYIEVVTKDWGIWNLTQTGVDYCNNQ